MKKMYNFIIALFFFFITSFSQCYAFEKESISTNTTMFLQPTLSLIVVIGLIYVVFGIYSKLNKYNLKKFSNKSEKTLELGRLTLVSHLPMGQNKSIDVVEINGKFLVLGVTADNISLIKEFDNIKEVNYVITEGSSKNESDWVEMNIESSSWKDLYQKYTKNESKNG